jgi:hypothetical protein
MAGTWSHAFGGTGRWLRREFRAIRPVFLFFLVGFLLLILLLKVALAQFSIETALISNAVIGALLAAKAALILDETPLARTLERYRGIIAVTVKMLFYGVTCLLLLYLERVLEVRHKLHHLDAAFGHVFRYGIRSVVVWALGISIVFALYFAFVEINERMGDGELWRLFFQSRASASDSGRTSTLRPSIESGSKAS